MNEARILVGDVRESLRGLPDGAVRCVVTSPPYWGLRDYGHDGQIGLEQTPDEYVAEMVGVFREVRRVLADDGTLWLNLGDSYASYRDGKATPDTTRGDSTGTLVPKGKAANRSASDFSGSPIKHKDLVGIPWRVAFALQADGWYLRQDIIWAKPNPMPESVTDRCTKAHEYVFLLTKQPRYYYDNDAIREEPKLDKRTATNKTPVEMNDKDVERMLMAKGIWGGNQMSKPRGAMYRGYDEVKGANRRSVWSINSKGFKGAHFAVMPEALVEPCVLAGSATGDTVLDPFSGSGTVGVVALRHGRNYIGCELNPEYAAISEERIREDAPLMNTVVVA